MLTSTQVIQSNMSMQTNNILNTLTFFYINTDLWKQSFLPACIVRSIIITARWCSERNRTVAASAAWTVHTQMQQSPRQTLNVKTICCKWTLVIGIMIILDLLAQNTPIMGLLCRPWLTFSICVCVICSEKIKENRGKQLTVQFPSLPSYYSSFLFCLPFFPAHSALYVKAASTATQKEPPLIDAHI